MLLSGLLWSLEDDVEVKLSDDVGLAEIQEQVTEYVIRLQVSGSHIRGTKKNETRLTDWMILTKREMPQWIIRNKKTGDEEAVFLIQLNKQTAGLEIKGMENQIN